MEDGAVRKAVYTVEYAALTAELRTARRAGGLSQRALAKLLKVPHTWVAKIDVVECALFFAACEVEPLAAFGRILAAGRKTRRPEGPVRGHS